MLRTYELSLNDVGTMTVRMEDFIKSSRDFDYTVHQMYEHNGVGALLTMEELQTLEKNAQQEDLTRNPNHDSDHQAPADMKRVAVEALQSIPQHLYTRLREVGE